MSSNFIIQASNPRLRAARDPDDASLSDAVQNVFPMDTECMLMTWNGVYIPLGYKYDVSLMTDDILNLCHDMLARAEGHRRINWPSNTFSTTWDVRWRSDVVSIDTRWNRVVGGTEGVLTERQSLSVPRRDFLAEWRRPLEIVSNALRCAGYESEQIPRIIFLHEVLTMLPTEAHLYGAEEG